MRILVIIVLTLTTYSFSQDNEELGHIDNLGHWAYGECTAILDQIAGQKMYIGNGLYLQELDLYYKRNVKKEIFIGDYVTDIKIDDSWGFERIYVGTANNGMLILDNNLNILNTIENDHSIVDISYFDYNKKYFALSYKSENPEYEINIYQNIGGILSKLSKSFEGSRVDFIQKFAGLNQSYDIAIRNGKLDIYSFDDTTTFNLKHTFYVNQFDEYTTQEYDFYNEFYVSKSKYFQIFSSLKYDSLIFQQILPISYNNYRFLRNYKLNCFTQNQWSLFALNRLTLNYDDSYLINFYTFNDTRDTLLSFFEKEIFDESPQYIYGVGSNYVIDPHLESQTSIVVSQPSLGLRIFGYKVKNTVYESEPFITGGIHKDLYIESYIAYVATGFGGIKIYNIANPSNMYMIGHLFIDTFVNSLQKVENLIYLAMGSAGLGIADISNLNDPVLLASYPFNGYVNSVTIRDNIAFISVHSSEYNLVKILDVANPLNATEISNINDVSGNIYLYDDYLFIGHSVYDISNLSNPFSIAGFQDFGNVIGMDSSIAYTSSGFILDIHNPYNPTELGQFDIGFKSITITGNIAYLAKGEDGFYIYDISDYSNPRRLGYKDTKGSVNDIEVYDNIIYVADGPDGLMSFEYWDYHLSLSAHQNPALSQFYNFIVTTNPTLDELTLRVKTESDSTDLNLQSISNNVYKAKYHFNQEGQLEVKVLGKYDNHDSTIVKHYGVATVSGNKNAVLGIPDSPIEIYITPKSKTDSAWFVLSDVNLVVNENSKTYTFKIGPLNEHTGKMFLIKEPYNKYEFYKIESDKWINLDVENRNGILKANIANHGEYALKIIEGKSRKSPNNFTVFPNYPNPFNNTTILKFYIPEATRVEAKIYDILGKELYSFVNDYQNPGLHEIKFKADKLSSGVYFYSLEAGNSKKYNKLLLVK